MLPILSLASVALLASTSAPSQTAVATGVKAARVAPKSAGAVEAADDAWATAELRGDFRYLERALATGYRSVDAHGKAVGREELIARVRSRGRSADYAAKVADWKAKHPSRAAVDLYGDTAILTWVDTSGDPGPISSCDIFIYRGRRWQAIYSQHTSAEE